jgi:hypothetical protein
MWLTGNADKGSVSELMMNSPLNALVGFAVDGSTVNALVLIFHDAS